ncbi:undecaprenyl-diphosphatase [Kroppenstedtia sanguinis]|uniref:Undecaprenyl-diphosphatase n=1 Tax=Kroppenstedtia sanguinis TaxID=1380684 RepID=A0ABW4CDI6_9BACL
MDYQIFKTINGWAGQVGWLDFIMIAFTEYVPYLFAGVLVLLVILRSTRPAGLMGFATLFLGFGISWVIGQLYERTRPFVDHDHVNMLVHHAADASFPSDHTTAAFTIACALWIYDRRMGIPMAVLALIMGFSRIWVGHHYPTDILGGILIGVLSAIVVAWAASKIIDKRQDKDRFQSTQS